MSNPPIGQCTAMASFTGVMFEAGEALAERVKQEACGYWRPDSADEASDMIESGKFKTWEQVGRLLDERTRIMEKQYAQDHKDSVSEK